MPDHALLDRMRQCCLADAALRQRLGACQTFDEAEGLLQHLAGAPIDDSLLAEITPLARAADNPPPDYILQTAPPADFLPVGLALIDGALMLEWLWFGPDDLKEPFFYRSTEKVALLPINGLMRCATPLAALDQWEDAPPPAGLIHHMSRCGSTLVSEMLAAVEGYRVISEAPILEAVLQAAALGLVPEDTVRKLAAALMRQRDGTGAPGFIKMDAWHSLALPMLARIFPQTPWVFLYREPAEVLVSHRRLPGLQVQRGVVPMHSYGLSGGEAIADAAYPAWVLEQVCRAPLASLHEGKGKLVNYAQLPQAVAQVILPHFGIAASDSAIAAMADRASRNSKSGERHFSSDSAEKQQEAARGESLLLTTGLQMAYDELEEMRTTGKPKTPSWIKSGPSGGVSLTYNW